MGGAIWPTSRDYDGELFQFDPSKLDRALAALRELFPSLHAELVTPAQLAALLSDLSSEFSWANIQDEDVFTREGSRRAIERWKANVEARRRYSFIAPLMFDQACLENPESESTHLIVDSFTTGKLVADEIDEQFGRADANRRELVMSIFEFRNRVLHEGLVIRREELTHDALDLVRRVLEHRIERLVGRSR